ncbi:hypothetical protein GTY88_17120 [Streptomyces sp. SID5926]|nr:hypothetical protein [Streptomyces sp. SID5926]
MPLGARGLPPHDHRTHGPGERDRTATTRHRIPTHTCPDAQTRTIGFTAGARHALRVGRVVQEGHAVAGESVHVVQVVPRPGGSDRAEVALDRPRVVDDQHLSSSG